MVNKVIKKLLLVVVILFAAEIASYLDFFGLQISQKDKLTLPYSYKPIPFEQRYEEAKELGFGKIFGAEKKGKPVVLCISSDAFGDGLEEKDTFGKKSRKNTMFPSICAHSAAGGCKTCIGNLSETIFTEKCPNHKQLS